MQFAFADNPQRKINSLKKQKHGYLIHTIHGRSF